MNKKVVLGIDLGGTNTVYALVTESGKIVYSNKFPTTGYDCFKPLAEDIHSDISEFLLKNKGYKLLSVGVGAPNGNFYNGTIEFAPNLPWKDEIPVKAILEELFGLPSAVTNDANAAAYGEMLYGGARKMKDFAVVTLGTGLGSGIVTGGQMLYGHRGFGGELGHITVKDNGRVCGCGKRGCLETYVSATGIKNTVLEMLASSGDDSLLRNEESLSGKIIEQAALKGDKIALAAFELTGKYLGKALANYATIFDPEAVFLFGGLSLAGDLILNPTRKYMEPELLKFHKGKIKLLLSQLDSNNAAILGAAAMAAMMG